MTEWRTWQKWALRGAIVSVRMYSHTIVYFYIRTSENLVNIGSSRHKLPRHLQFCVSDTNPSGQNWSGTLCRHRHVATCRQHFQLRSREFTHTTLIHTEKTNRWVEGQTPVRATSGTTNDRHFQYVRCLSTKNPIIMCVTDPDPERENTRCVGWVTTEFSRIIDRICWFDQICWAFAFFRLIPKKLTKFVGPLPFSA